MKEHPCKNIVRTEFMCNSSLVLHSRDLYCIVGDNAMGLNKRLMNLFPSKTWNIAIKKLHTIQSRVRGGACLWYSGAQFLSFAEDHEQEPQCHSRGIVK